MVATIVLVSSQLPLASPRRGNSYILLFIEVDSFKFMVTSMPLISICSTSFPLTSIMTQREEMGLTLEKAGFGPLQRRHGGGPETRKVERQELDWGRLLYICEKDWSLRLLTLIFFLYQDDRREIRHAGCRNLRPRHSERTTEDMPQVQLIIKLEFVKLWVIVMEWNRVRYVAN